MPTPLANSVRRALLTICLVLAPGLAAAQVTPPWESADVGAPTLAGSATGGPSSFSVDGSGADVWGILDQFRFVYQRVTGDVEITARVDSLTWANDYSKAGVMIRGDLTHGSANAFAMVSAARGMMFTRRLTAGGLTTMTPGEMAAAPRWVRLVRRGSQVTSYASVDGTTWGTMGSASVSLPSAIYVGLAVTSHNVAARSTATFSSVSLQLLNLPDPFQHVDIGPPAMAGDAVFYDNAFWVSAGGRDISGTSDEFHFVYRPLTGDADVVARVASMTPVDPWTKAGVMIRESLAADSRHAFALISAANGYGFERRNDTGGASDFTSGGAGAAPGWVRLARAGPIVTAYRSADGVAWTVMGSDSVPLGSTVYVGIAVTSRSTTTTTLATVDGVSVTATQPVNQPPVVSLTAPANGATFAAPATIALAATASDPEGRLDRVDFFRNGLLVGTDNTAPFTASMASVAAGAYSLTAVAVDLDGASTTSAVVSVTVNAPANQPPVVSLTEPANNATFAPPATIVMTATASDPEGRLARVNFYRNGMQVGTDNTAPFTITLTSVFVGTYTLTAVAQDLDGASTTSAVATVTVRGRNLPPVVSLTAPANGASFLAPATITLTATASDPEGRLSRVDFFRDGTLVNMDSAAPFTTSLTSVAAGTYVLTAVAVDLDGGSATSPAASVTVTAPNQPPTVSLTAPANGAVFTAPATIAVSASASDPENRLSRVDFFRNGAPVGSDNTAPFSVSMTSVPAGSYSLTAVAVDLDGGSTTSAAVSVTVNPPANQPPVVTLTAPANGAVFTAPATIAVSASASDPENRLSRVDFFRNGTLVGSDNTAPFSVSMTAVPAGSYSLTAVAVDLDGGSTTSAAVAVTVNAPNQLPSVNITAPANGAVFTAPAAITVSANASDPENRLNRVDFFRNGTFLGSDNTAPFSVSMTAVPAGSYSLTAVALDLDGGSWTSAAVSVTVNPPANQPPVVTLTAPANGATFTAPATITLTATASDPEGRLSRVEFYANGSFVTSVTAAPFTVPIPSVPAGSYAFSAVAVDLDGASATSATATVTVNPEPVGPPRLVVFEASSDHAAVTSYLLEIFANGANPDTATPIASSDLGKPTPAANGDITVDRATFFSALAPGTYQATVGAVNANGISRCVAVTFTR